MNLRAGLRAALLAAAIVPAARADDDVVRGEEPEPPQPQAPPFFGGAAVPGGGVIIVPGLRLEVGGLAGQGQLQLQVQGGLPAPAADAPRQAYLGVVAGPVSAPVRAQLDLPEGVGLSIEVVAPGSPAEKAGVRQFDVIHKFGDQVICSPEQLTALVRVAGAGTKVPLTLRRGGREQVVEAVLEERAAAGDAAVFGAMPGVLNLQALVPPGAGGGLAPQLQADIERRVAEAMARAGVGGVFPGALVPGVAGNVRAQVLTVGPNAQSATVVSDARGTVEIRSANGRKTVTVKDPTGTEVYSGPLDDDEDRDKVPAEYRDWVREVDGGGPVVRALAPDPADPAAELDEAPAEEAPDESPEHGSEAEAPGI